MYCTVLHCTALYCTVLYLPGDSQGAELQPQDEPEVADGAGPDLAPLQHDDRLRLQLAHRGDFRRDQHRGEQSTMNSEH